MDDLAAARTVGAAIQELARQHIFAGEPELLLELPAATVRGKSFRAEFRLQLDAEGPNSDVVHGMLVVRFGPSDGRLPESPWSICVRGHWPTRQDRLPTRGKLAVKKLRRFYVPARQLSALDDGHAVHEGDDLYVMPATPPEDVVAQVALFLLQTRLSSHDELAEWFHSYLGTFNRGRMDKPDFEAAMFAHLLGHKWWLEDARAWRKYIRATASGVNRAQGSVAERPARFDPSRQVYTIDEVHELTGQSRSGLYAKARDGRLTISKVRGRTVIPKSVVDELARAPRSQSTVRLVMDIVCCSYHAAHKLVTRERLRGLPASELVLRLRSRQRTPRRPS